MAKIVFALVWAGVLFAVVGALKGVAWAQYLAIFVLAGIYAFGVDKVSNVRGKGAREGSER